MTSEAEDESDFYLHEALRSPGFRQKLWRVAWLHCRDAQLAEDCVQEAFTLATVKRSDLQVASEEHLRSWLVRTTQNFARNARRKNATSVNHAETLSDYKRLRSEIDTDPLTALEREENTHRLRSAISQLSEEQRVVVELRLGRDLTFAEIATQTGVSLGTVLSRMRLALEKLRKQFSDRDLE